MLVPQERLALCQVLCWMLGTQVIRPRPYPWRVPQLVGVCRKRGGVQAEVGRSQEGFVEDVLELGL